MKTENIKMESVKIEKVTIEDAKQILAIYEPYVQSTAITFEVETPDLKEFTDRIINISKKYPYLKAVCNGEILGYAYAGCFKGRAAYDWSVETTIYIRQDCRNLGIGRLLYEALERSLAQMGILNMNACIASPTEEDEYLNNDSQYFHEKMGFDMVGKFHNSGSKFGKWYDMIWMEKMIGEHKENPQPVTFGKFY